MYRDLPVKPTMLDKLGCNIELAYHRSIREQEIYSIIYHEIYFQGGKQNSVNAINGCVRTTKQECFAL